VKRALAGLAVLAIAAGCGGGATTAPRPDLQKTLNALVTGKTRVAPGAVAYVSGPKGTWIGTAGWADVKSHTKMAAGTRSRLGSVSKLWTAVVVAKLAEEKMLKLTDAVDHWLPGFFPYGKRITIDELLHHTSGMIDDNDFSARPEYWLAKIHDSKLRQQILALAAKLQEDPSTPVSSEFEMRIAAALPLLFDPGMAFHYSNIGYKTLGVIAEKAGGATLPTLYERYIIGPLHLRNVADDATATISGKHATPYIVEKNGVLRDATHLDMGSLEGSGGVVSDVRDEATFLTALVRGKILGPAMLKKLETPGPGYYGFGIGVEPLCGDTVYNHGGATSATMAEVGVNGDGSRVVVLLLNGRTWNSWGDDAPVEAMHTLYCAA
jgi:D-alanyl-D-alanine carboxypeptidase